MWEACHVASSAFSNDHHCHYSFLNLTSGTDPSLIDHDMGAIDPSQIDNHDMTNGASMEPGVPGATQCLL